MEQSLKLDRSCWDAVAQPLAEPRRALHFRAESPPPHRALEVEGNADARRAMCSELLPHVVQQKHCIVAFQIRTLTLHKLAQTTEIVGIHAARLTHLE